MNNRILQIPLTPAALVQIETALRLRSAALHGLADDSPSSYAAKHYRNAGNSYSRLAGFIGEYLAAFTRDGDLAPNGEPWGDEDADMKLPRGF